jgi:transketolase
MGWHVAHADMDHPDSLVRAFAECRAVSGKPQIIIYRTVIGSGLNKTCASSKCHGAPVGLDEITHFVEHSPLKDYFAKKTRRGSTEQIAAALKEQIASGRFISREEFFAEQPA